jgi:hypothetical protein
VQYSASNHSSLGSVQSSSQKVSILNPHAPIARLPAFKNLALKNAKTKGCESGQMAFLVYQDKSDNESRIVSEYLCTDAFRIE